MGVHKNKLYKNANYIRDKIFTNRLWIITALVLILIFGLLIYILSKGLPKITPGFLVDLTR